MESNHPVGGGVTRIEHPLFRIRTMKKITHDIVVRPLMLGGEVYASAWREIYDTISDRKALDVMDQQILEVLSAYIRCAPAPFSDLAVKEMWGGFYNRGLSRHQQQLIFAY